MLRVTENMIYSSMSKDIARAGKRHFQAQENAQTGVRVHKASDDTVGANLNSLLETSIARLEVMGRVSNRSELILNASESALGHADNILIRAKEIVLAAANSTYSNLERQTMVEELTILRDQLLAAANTKVDGMYIFGGFLDTSAPFQNDGTFIGDNNVRMVEIAPNTRIAANVSGSDAFTVTGGQDIFTMLDTLIIDVNANNAANIQTGLTNLDNAREQITAVRVDTGNLLNAIESASFRREEQVELLERGRQDAIGVDPAQSLADLAQAQQALQSALSQASYILSSLRERLLF